jgi:hypothetical protein
VGIYYLRGVVDLGVLAPTSLQQLWVQMPEPALLGPVTLLNRAVLDTDPQQVCQPFDCTFAATHVSGRKRRIGPKDFAQCVRSITEQHLPFLHARHLSEAS